MSGKGAFLENAKIYLDRGWQPIPMPPKKKSPPMSNTTGKRAPRFDYRDLVHWNESTLSAMDRDLGERISWSGEDSNIAIHAHEVLDPSTGNPILIANADGQMVPAEILGIDVDAYEGKTGDETIRSWEKQYGRLPETWISSARDNGMSGIRYYLVPSGYSWRGNLGQDSGVDIIHRGHRYAMVFPSFHPKSDEALGKGNGQGGAGQYLWFRPGVMPTGWSDSTMGQAGVGSSISDTVPKAWELAHLPSDWLDPLTRGFMPFSADDVDMEIEEKELLPWLRSAAGQKGGRTKGDVDELFEDVLDKDSGTACALVRKRMIEGVRAITENENSHDTFLAYQWNMLNMAKEGHKGWATGNSVLEKTFIRHTLGGDGGEQKRDVFEVREEVRRARTFAVRKIKAKVGKAIDEGVPISVPVCGCYEGDAGLVESAGAEGGEFDGGLSEAKDPKDYERNDDGNAEHFLDLLGNNFKYVQERQQWIYWENRRGGWGSDASGHISRRGWRMVKRRQQKFAKQLLQQAIATSRTDPEEGKRLLKVANKWSDWADSSGNNHRAEAALRAAQSFYEVSMSYSQVDSNRHLIGVVDLEDPEKRKILELGPNGAFVRNAERDDFVTKNTNTPYISWENLRKLARDSPNGDISVGYSLWKEYLDTFLPDLELREWVQQLMGYCLFGANPLRKIIFLFGNTSTGKSTMLNAVMSAMGEYASSQTMNIFSEDLANPQLVQSIDDRIITLSEVEGGGKDGKVSSAMLKRMSGMDVVRARNLFSNEVISKVPAFTPVIATNAAPPVDRSDAALERRVLVVPFNTQVVHDDPEKMIEIETKCPVAVLSWMVEGWKLYCEHGLKNEPSSESVVSAREEFNNSMSPLGDYLSEWVEKTGNPEDIVAFDEMFLAYERYCREQRIDKAWNKKRFADELSSAHIEKYGKTWRDSDGKMKKARVGVRMKREAKGEFFNFKVDGKPSA